MIRFIVLSIMLCVTGCASVEPASTVAEQVTRPVTIVWHKTDKAWLHFSHQYPWLRDAGKTAGFYKILDGVCHVWAPDDPLRFNVFGHEVKHCFDGLFHD